MSNPFTMKDFVAHLKMLRDGKKLVATLANDLHARGVKLDTFEILHDAAYSFCLSMKTHIVSELIDTIEAAPKLFDEIEKFWQEQQNKRRHKKGFIGEPLLQLLCEYMIGYRDVRKNTVEEI
jgi:hypothetical protein